MKISIERNVVTLISTNHFEFSFLVDAYKDFVAPSVEPTFVPPPTNKKRKRYLHTNTCDLCGKNVKGPAAMGMHMRMHRRKGERVIKVMSET